MDQRIKIIAQIMKGRNPKDVALDMIKSGKIDDPNIKSLVQMAEGNQTDALVNLASQMFENNGLNLNTELQDLMSLLK